MKSFILGGLMMLCSSMAMATDVFEIVSLKFKEGVKLDEQKKLMAELNSVIKKFNGFKSRDYYFSEENGRWIDYVVWTDLALAKKASESAMNDPAAGAVFSKIDEMSMIFSHYQRVGGVKKD